MPKTCSQRFLEVKRFKTDWNYAFKTLGLENARLILDPRDNESQLVIAKFSDSENDFHGIFNTDLEFIQFIKIKPYSESFTNPYSNFFFIV